VVLGDRGHPACDLAERVAGGALEAHQGELLVAPEQIDKGAACGVGGAGYGAHGGRGLQVGPDHQALARLQVQADAHDHVGEAAQLVLGGEGAHWSPRCELRMRGTIARLAAGNCG
jgi:hypothetical protein